VEEGSREEGRKKLLGECKGGLNNNNKKNTNELKR
jgi:hypothetical protein